ncbi:MAG: hypothetical protein JO033_14525 [Acidobacteriaceae bacterium]|nr:hypothetical protein [Acidobacteriaceae bacterium]MBV9497911.1 hypothetical protein [Acidobacteriaceae bacterium]
MLLVLAAAAFSWIPQVSNTTASLRGLDAVSSKIVWASGTQATWLRTIDGGLHWQAGTVAGAESLDFRDVAAFDAVTAFLLSSGPGAQSRIYQTIDGGRNWRLLFTNPDTDGFFDAISFWDRRHGIVLGDPVNGKFTIFTTDDAGRSWQRRPTRSALPNEGAFAASGTCLVVQSCSKAWFATGGAAARVFLSTDRGRSWTVSSTPLSGATSSAGIFSLAFSDSLHGIAVGGDYTKPDVRARTVAITTDGGKSWSTAKQELFGYRSAVTFIRSQPGTIVAVGTNGSDISFDAGATWIEFSSTPFNAVTSAPDGSMWAVGPKGVIAKLARTPNGQSRASRVSP